MLAPRMGEEGMAVLEELMAGAQRGDLCGAFGALCRAL
jgi:hypothetical protein